MPHLEGAQKLLADECRKSDIRCVDLAPALLARNGAPRDLYLFADGIHFSPLGHRVAFEAMKRELSPALAAPGPAAR